METRNTSAIAFYCRASKKDKQGYSPIEVSVTINKQRVFIYTPRKEKPQTFNKLLKQRTSNELTTFLMLYREKVNEAMNILLKLNKEISATEIKKILKGGIGEKTITIEMVVREFLTSVGQRTIGLDQLKRYHQVGDFLIYLFGKGKDVKEITVADMRTIYARIARENKPSTAGGKMAKVKSIFAFALESGYITTTPTIGIKIKKERPKVEYLTSEELRNIQTKELHTPRLDAVRDLFLLQCYSGLSFSDLQEMDPNKIETINGASVYKGERKKTKIPFISVLAPNFLTIIKKYGNRIPKMSNQKNNAYLKEIGVLCGIEKNLHTHLARKTYAHTLIEAGVSMEVIAKCLGHSNTRITEAIYAIPSTERIVNAANIW